MSDSMLSLHGAHIALDEAGARVRDDAAARELLTRARLAAEEHDLDLAMRLAWRAVTGRGASSSVRETALMTLADWLVECGVYDAAADAWVVVYGTTADAGRRDRAGIGLMEVAALEARASLFEHYRAQIDPVELTPELAVLYFYTLGEGMLLLGHREDARAALERSRRLAAEHGLDVEVFRAEEALLGLEEDLRLTGHLPREVSPDLSAVAGAVREYRVTSGLGVRVSGCVSCSE